MEIQYGGDVVFCPISETRTKFHPMGKRRAYACQGCGHHIYPCGRDHLPQIQHEALDLVFAMYLMTSTRHGVAAKEIERQIGVTYKCAWRICHELLKLMATAGHVEIDETLMGGVAKGGSSQRMRNKTIVFGMVQRGGRLIASPIPDTSKATVEPLITEHIVKGSRISTDEHATYGDLGMDLEAFPQGIRSRPGSREHA